VFQINKYFKILTNYYQNKYHFADYRKRLKS